MREEITKDLKGLNGTECIEEIFPTLESMVGDILFGYGYFNGKDSIYVAIKQPFKDNVNKIVNLMDELNIRYNKLILLYEDTAVINELFVYGIKSGKLCTSDSFYK